MSLIHPAEAVIRHALLLNPHALATAEQIMPPAVVEVVEAAKQAATPQPLRRKLRLWNMTVPATLESGILAANKHRYTPVGSLLR